MRRARPIVTLWLAAALFVAACLVLASRSGARLAPGPRFVSEDGRLVIEEDRLLACLPEASARVGALREGVRLYANVDLTFRAVTPRLDSASMHVQARGRALDGVWPLLTLHVDGAHRGGFFVDSRDWRVYTTTFDLAPGEHHFRLSYVNDRPGFPGKRDVDLRHVGLDRGTRAGRLFASAGEPPLPGAFRSRVEEDQSLLLTRRAHDVSPTGLDLDSGSSLVDGSRVLWSDGYVGRSVIAPESGTWRLTVRASGDACDGQGPRMLLVAGDDQWLSWEVRSGVVRDYAVDLDLVAGRQEILLVYDNDKVVPGHCDRNLRIAGLRLEPREPTGARIE